MTEALLDPDDRWNLRHYLKRIDPYYGPDAEAARALLDLASDGEARTLDELARLANTVELDPRPDRDALAHVVESLAADHYLSVMPGRLPPTYHFASDLLSRAWRVLRHLP